MKLGQLTAAIDALESQSYRFVVNFSDVVNLLKRYADIEGERIVTSDDGEKTPLNFAAQLDMLRGEAMSIRGGLGRLRAISEEEAREYGDVLNELFKKMEKR